jgi:hypothetical protein
VLKPYAFTMITLMFLYHLQVLLKGYGNVVREIFHSLLVFITSWGTWREIVALIQPAGCKLQDQIHFPS